jgi:hypothetical protein
VKLGRRALLKGSAIWSGAIGSSALGLGPLARAVPPADVTIHDSRLGAAPAPGAMQTIDLVDERCARWATIRSGLPAARRIEGTAAWSDYVMIAHELQRSGFLRVAEARQGRGWHFVLERARV